MSTDFSPRPDPRNRYRTAIIGVGVLVAMLAIRLLYEVVPAQFLGSLAYSLALALNVLALVAVFGGLGWARRAGIGYAACGWAYLLLAYVEAGGFGRIPPLITSVIFEAALGPINGPRFGGGGGFIGNVNAGQLLWTAHSLATIAAGVGGAWFAVRLPGRRSRPGPALPAVGDLLDRWRSRPAAAPPRPVETIHPLDRTD